MFSSLKQILLAYVSVCLALVALPVGDGVGQVWFSFIGSAHAQDGDDDDDGADDDDDDDDNGAGGGAGGGGAGGGGSAAADVEGFSDFDDDQSLDIRDCAEESLLLPSWLRECKRRRVVPTPRPPRRVARPPAPRRAIEAAPRDAIPREIVLLAKSDGNIQVLTARGFTVVAQSPAAILGGTLVRFRVPADLSTSQALTVARQLVPEAVADLNHIYRPGQEACTTQECRQREIVGWPRNPEACSLAPTIGLIDTAVDINNPALVGQGLEIVSHTRDRRTRSGDEHGTAVAALLVGRADGAVPGLLPQARIVAFDAFHKTNKGEDIADTYDIVRAIEALLQRVVPVINMSFTGAGNEVLAAAVGVAKSRNVALVASAGNQGPGSPTQYPAGYDAAVAVTAVSVDLRIYRRANRGKHIEFSAPGVKVPVAARGGGTRFETGTSFATPFISAAIAAALASRPGARPDVVINDLRKSASDLGAPGHDAIYGWGLLQVRGICQ